MPYRPDAEPRLATDRNPDDDVAHQGRHGAVADEVDVGVVFIEEELGRVAEVDFEPGDPCPHPGERATPAELAVDALVEVDVVQVSVERQSKKR